jgi:hypothetical protein
LHVNGYSRTIGNTEATIGSLCNIYLPDSYITGDNVLYSYKRQGSQPDESYVYYFPSPSKVGKLDITLYLPNGALATFGNDQRFVLCFELRALSRQNIPVC